MPPDLLDALPIHGLVRLASSLKYGTWARTRRPYFSRLRLTSQQIKRKPITQSLLEQSGQTYFQARTMNCFQRIPESRGALHSPCDDSRGQLEQKNKEGICLHKHTLERPRSPIPHTSYLPSRHRPHVHFTPQHFLLCQPGLY